MPDESILTRPALELEGVARRFGRRWALRGVTLTVPAAQVVALVGHNGSGKSTLVRVAATLLRPTRGRVRVFGEGTGSALQEVRGGIAMLGHSTGLYLDLTALENLVFAQKMRGSATDRDMLRDRLAEVGLGAEHDTPVRGFSAGMRRRLALARAMLAAPRLLLLDEPFASFDDDGVRLLERFVERVRSSGGSVLVATHDLVRAAPLIQRVVRLEGGRLAEDRAVNPPGGEEAGVEEGILAGIGPGGRS